MMRPPPTVVIVNDYADINGGAAYVALSSAIGLARVGMPVILLSACEPRMPELTAAGIAVVTTGQRDLVTEESRIRAAVQGLWNERARTQMSELLRPLDPNRTIVHVHGWTKALSSSVFFAARAQRTRIVVTLHDYFVACPNGGFFDYQAGEICGERPLSIGCATRNCDVRSYPQKLYRLARHQVQRAVGRIPEGVSAFIAVSEFSRNILQPYLPAEARTFQIANPIDVERAPRVEVVHNDRFVYVGRLSEEKGVLLFARVAARLGLRPLFIGDGPLGADIRRICPDAEITGWLPREEVKRRLAEARALVMPSLWYETQGLVVLEAAAMGVPALVPDRSAARDAVVDGETGLWFRSGDAASLAAAIERTSAQAAEKWGRGGYDRYWANAPTLSSHVDALSDCYSAVLGEELP
jgi:glycosyltransferase involved in cell wall biosynthesis